jgi:glycosyltransferase involved in cell wall biosynthesis
VIYNALVTKSPVEGKRLTRADLGLPDDAPVVVLVANLRPVKRIDRFIDMAAQVVEKRPDTRFAILGAGELRESLARQAVDLGLGDRVHFAGSVPEVGPYLELFDVGVLTSESEGLSNTLIEYSYYSLPAVAFDTGGNSEVVEEAVSGFLVPEGDLSAMADRVLRLLGDSDLKRRMGQAGRARVEELFSPERRLAEFEEFFLSITMTRKRAVQFD